MESPIRGARMDVAGVGVLLGDPSGIGKSECALEWIHWGHRLVADDRPRVSLRAEDRCLPGVPPTLVAVAARETTSEVGH